jgi:hypothetical protein
MLANVHVSAERFHRVTFQGGFKGSFQPFTERRFIMAVQTFALGNVVITPNALGQLTPADIQLGLQRHQSGDWGDLGQEDWQENDHALRTGLRLLSSYRSAGGATFWIITEASRQITTVLMPDDY